MLALQFFITDIAEWNVATRGNGLGGTDKTENDLVQLETNLLAADVDLVCVLHHVFFDLTLLIHLVIVLRSHPAWC